MSIRVTCCNCQAQFQTRDEHAGKRGKCPKCQTALVVPTAIPAAPAAPASPSPKPQTPAPLDRKAIEKEFLDGFVGKIEPIRAPWAYRFGIVLVATVMVLLPCIYVGLIGLVGWLVYLHAIFDTGLMNVRGNGRAVIAAFLMYLAPIVAGAILIAFMIKPLFARPVKIERRRSLSREGEPLLFAFVDRICATVGSPHPKRIDVDCEVNASASFRRGVWSMLVGNDLVLTIGMPLVVGMNTRQFTEVLAHEFGHFTQGTGMRLTYIIRSISFWFTRVVYERDAWDEHLINWSRTSDGRLAIFFLLTRLFVWLTRKVLWVLMMVGHAVAGFLLRQMEYDADRAAARVVGAAAAESSTSALVLLGIANQAAVSDLNEFHREGRLSDNLPRLVAANLAQFTSEIDAHVAQVIEKSRTGIFDTHPCHKDRIAAVRRENAPGVFHVERPAPMLFSDFDSLARNVTWDVYRGIFGSNFMPTDMHPTEDLLRRQEQDLAVNKSLARYFQGAFNNLRPLPIASHLDTRNIEPAALVQNLKDARQRMLAAVPQYKASFKEFDEADTQLIEVEQARSLIAAGFKLKPKTFSMFLTGTEDAGRVTRLAREKQERCGADLRPFEDAAGERINAALRLLSVPAVAARVSDAETRLAGIEKMLSVLSLLKRQLPETIQLRNQRAALGILVSNLQNNEKDQQLIREILVRMKALASCVCNLYTTLGAQQYPLDHAKGDISLGNYALEKLPAEQDLGAVLEAAGEMLEKLAMLHVRIAARLADTATEVETALGLPVLPEPVREKSA